MNADEAKAALVEAGARASEGRDYVPIGAAHGAALPVWVERDGEET